MAAVLGRRNRRSGAPGPSRSTASPSISAPLPPRSTATRHLEQRRAPRRRSGRRRHRRAAGDRARRSRPGSRSIAASRSTPVPARPASPASSPPATSPAGPTGAPARRIRVEHWVVAERQGQTAARNMLGRRERFDAVPFFWTQQLRPDHCPMSATRGNGTGSRSTGSLDDRNAAVSYWRDGRKLAVLTIGRDRDSLAAELELEQTIAAGA